MSFSQLGYPQFLSASPEAYGGERTGVLSASTREGSSESGGNPSAGAPAVTSMLGMYASPWTAQNYSAFLPYNSAELALLSQMGSQYELKDSPGAHPSGFVHPAPGFYPYGQYQYGDPSRAKSATRETTSTLKAWLQEHKKNPYPTKGEKIMLAIITKMTLTQVSTWFANARRRLKKENKVTWGRSAEDRDGRIFDSDNEEDHDKNEDDEEIDLESIDVVKTDENTEEQSKLEQVSLDKPSAGERVNVENMEPKRTLPLPELKGVSDSLAINKEPQVVKNVPALSPDGPGCHRPSNTKPKIWSLAETATSPDNSQKVGALTAPVGLRTSLPSHHPAFLPTHGIYTCQIGKLHNWAASAAFLSANSLMNVRSLLGVNQSSHNYSHSPAAHIKRSPSPAGHSGPEGDSENSSDGFSPQRHDQENVQQRIEPRTPVLRSPFPQMHDRSHHEATHRVLKTVS
ncbi:hypothetical protein AALO_G00258170 [Alosa alosa]|uniref:Homeobox domain-containing protein n=1 Tax=Alosa alosa TaxID=278164 RepID=A0AAV6FUG8_9TELE|nr:iroquois-class homeodomain protein IRX-1b [Alosa sapidissima]XP_048085713.1 iroquois-class homeodomain protein IRX-1b [Alosa alosa]KAG5264802.1 hypothetical protein AALO_G00258170 [Alosa alosa]